MRRALDALRDPAIAATAQRFSKTGSGGHGQGDRFLGLRVAQLRALAREYRSLQLDAEVEHLRSPWHEERMLELLILDARRRSRSGATGARRAPRLGTRSSVCLRRAGQWFALGYDVEV